MEFKCDDDDDDDEEEMNFLSDLFVCGFAFFCFFFTIIT